MSSFAVKQPEADLAPRLGTAPRIGMNRRVFPRAVERRAQVLRPCTWWVGVEAQAPVKDRSTAVLRVMPATNVFATRYRRNQETARRGFVILFLARRESLCSALAVPHMTVCGLSAFVHASPTSATSLLSFEGVL